MDTISVDVMNIATGNAWEEFVDLDKRQRRDCRRTDARAEARPTDHRRRDCARIGPPDTLDG
ncbi:MAG: hypothetical protein OXQ31_09770 [Spirochaetaceae bacterium]|nr:hypothetical protein [Spirochaetaceae bacterium]